MDAAYKAQMHIDRPLCAVCWFADPRPIMTRAVMTLNGHSVCALHCKAAAVSTDFDTVMKARAKKHGLIWEGVKER